MRTRLTAPEGVRGVVRHRLARLSAETQQALSAAAVVGHDFDMGTLAALDDLRGHAILAALEKGGTTARLVSATPGSAARYARSRTDSRNPVPPISAVPRASSITRLALRSKPAGGRTSTRTPASLHAASPRQRLAATHSTVEHALAYARLAGERASGRFAYEDAARWWRVVSDLLEATAADAADRCDALLTLAEALLMCGAARQVVDDIAPAALAIAETLGDAGDCARRAHLPSGAGRLDPLRGTRLPGRRASLSLVGGARGAPCAALDGRSSARGHCARRRGIRKRRSGAHAGRLPARIGSCARSW